VKDLKKYNRVIFSLILLILIIIIILISIKVLLVKKTTFYYITFDNKIKGEAQILPDSYTQLQLVRHYFSGPINVKKFKKDIYHQIEIDNVYFIDRVCKITLSNESSSIFNSYPEELKEYFAKAAFISLKKTKEFHNLLIIEFYIYQKLKAFSFPFKN